MAKLNTETEKISVFQRKKFGRIDFLFYIDYYQRESDLQRTYSETIMFIVIDSTATNKIFLLYRYRLLLFADFWTST